MVKDLTFQGHALLLHVEDLQKVYIHVEKKILSHLVHCQAVPKQHQVTIPEGVLLLYQSYKRVCKFQNMSNESQK